jgi:hypothetical protein
MTWSDLLCSQQRAAEQCYRQLLHSSRFHAHGIDGLAAIQQLRRPGAAASISIAGTSSRKDREKKG